MNKPIHILPELLPELKMSTFEIHLLTYLSHPLGGDMIRSKYKII